MTKIEPNRVFARWAFETDIAAEQAKDEIKEGIVISFGVNDVNEELDEQYEGFGWQDKDPKVTIERDKKSKLWILTWSCSAFELEETIDALLEDNEDLSRKDLEPWFSPIQIEGPRTLGKDGIDSNSEAFAFGHTVKNLKKG